MRYPSTLFHQENCILSVTMPIILLISCMATRLSSASSSLEELSLDGHFSFEENEFAARDFGNQFHFLPSEVLHPVSVSDIATTINHVWRMGLGSELTVAARGHGHSLQGQAQAANGIVINMESLKAGNGMHVHTGQFPYVDVSAGELWIDVLQECLRFGLAPKSWTDYLHLTVGGTLSNAGISGQAFHHGPQISNVEQLEVVTGTGEVIICSEEENGDLFHGVLGGLGQFSIITRARISLERAPEMVKWIRVLYSDFDIFAKDQESLISADNTFDYIEGLVIINKTGLIHNWRSSFNPQDPLKANQFVSDGRTLFCLELTKNFNSENADTVDQEIQSFLSQLNYIRSTPFVSEVSYLKFLDRVHSAELKLRLEGLWDLPHPWLNLLVPKSKIHNFARVVFGNILRDTNNGPVLVYPMNKSKWDNRTSVVLPEDDVFYLVAFLPHTISTPTQDDGLQYLLSINNRILDFCITADIGAKQYLPCYTTEEEWRQHFGDQWEDFVRRKSAYDPLAILAPGQRIFRKPITARAMQQQQE